MAVLKRKSRTVSLRLSEDEYKLLYQDCIAKGARSVSDYSRHLLFGAARNPADLPPTNSLEDRLNRFALDLHILAREVQRLRAAYTALKRVRDRRVVGVILPALLALIFSISALAQSPDPSVRTYILGPDDQIVVHALDAEEISDKPIRIDMRGNIRLPLVGRLKAGGLTIDQLEASIAQHLKEFVHTPDVSVSIAEFRSQPVSVIGSVKSPGVHQLQGRKTLVEILSLAGGLADDSGYSVRIARRLEWGRIPLANAHDDSTGSFSVALVELKPLMEASNPAGNIVIKPNDVVSVPRAEMIYVTGQVQRAGGFVLRERESLSALQALSLAGGLDRSASPKSARILRTPRPGVARSEIPVDLKKILTGKLNDVPLQAEDILFIPASAPKRAVIRAAEAALQVGTGLAIYRR